MMPEPKHSKRTRSICARRNKKMLVLLWTAYQQTLDTHRRKMELANVKKVKNPKLPLMDELLANMRSKDFKPENVLFYLLKQNKLPLDDDFILDKVNEWKREQQLRFEKYPTLHPANTVSAEHMAATASVSMDESINLEVWTEFIAKTVSFFKGRKVPQVLRIEFGFTKLAPKSTIIALAMDLSKPIMLVDDMEAPLLNQLLSKRIPQLLEVKFGKKLPLNRTQYSGIGTFLHKFKTYPLGSKSKAERKSLLPFDGMRPGKVIDVSKYGASTIGSLVRLYAKTESTEFDYDADQNEDQIFMHSFQTAEPGLRVTFALRNIANNVFEVIGIYVYTETSIGQEQLAPKKLRFAKCVICAEKALSMCGSCARVPYCGQACANKHWSSHACGGKK